MKIAVVSDMHIGEAARGKDLNVDVSVNGVEENYINKFCQFARDKNLTADYLLISGDITHTAAPKEFEIASNVIAKIAETLGVTENRIVVIPGNHDTNWKMHEQMVADNATELAIMKGKYQYLLDESHIFYSIIESAEGSIYKEPYLTYWNYDDVVVVGYNSSVNDSFNSTHHHGDIQIEHVEALEKKLNEMKDVNKDKLKVFLVHHHPVLYGDRTFSRPDLSAMTNSEALLSVLSKNNFDVLIHGHKHIPRFKISVDSNGFPLCILCSGSFSALLEDKWFGATGNFFHLINIEQRCEQKATCKGTVSSWVHLTGNGWLEGDKKFGMPFEERFGSYSTPQELKNNLSPLILKKFENENVIRWKDLIDDNADLQYVPNQLLDNVLSDLSGEIGFDLTVIEAAACKTDGLILIRRN
jgi:predicted phosphodiesterase